MKTIFEQGAPGHGLSLLPACDVPVVTLAAGAQKAAAPAAGERK